MPRRLLPALSLVILACLTTGVVLMSRPSVPPPTVSEPATKDATEPTEDRSPSVTQAQELLAFPADKNAKPPAPEPVADVLNQADTRFFHKGLLISPGLLQEFLTPGVVELDLLLPGRNRNDCDFSVKRLADGADWAILASPNDDTAKILRYRHLGRTTSGIHVLRIEQIDADAFTLHCRLLLVRVIAAGRPTWAEPVDTLHRRLADVPTVALRLVGDINLGDRDRRRVTLDGNNLLLTDPLDASARLKLTVPPTL